MSGEKKRGYVEYLRFVKLSSIGMVKLNKFFSYKHVEIQHAPLPVQAMAAESVGIIVAWVKKISMKKCTQKYLRFSCTKLSSFLEPSTPSTRKLNKFTSVTQKCVDI